MIRRLVLFLVVLLLLAILAQSALAESISYRDWLLEFEQVEQAETAVFSPKSYPAPVEPEPTEKKPKPKVPEPYPAPVEEPTPLPEQKVTSTYWVVHLPEGGVTLAYFNPQPLILDSKIKNGTKFYLISWHGGEAWARPVNYLPTPVSPTPAPTAKVDE